MHAPVLFSAGPTCRLQKKRSRDSPLSFLRRGVSLHANDEADAAVSSRAMHARENAAPYSFASSTRRCCRALGYRRTCMALCGRHRPGRWSAGDAEPPRLLPSQGRLSFTPLLSAERKSRDAVSFRRRAVSFSEPSCRDASQRAAAPCPSAWWPRLRQHGPRRNHPSVSCRSQDRRALRRLPQPLHYFFRSVNAAPVAPSRAGNAEPLTGRTTP